MIEELKLWEWSTRMREDEMFGSNWLNEYY